MKNISRKFIYLQKILVKIIFLNLYTMKGDQTVGIKIQLKIKLHKEIQR